MHNAGRLLFSRKLNVMQSTWDFSQKSAEWITSPSFFYKITVRCQFLLILGGNNDFTKQFYTQLKKLTELGKENSIIWKKTKLMIYCLALTKFGTTLEAAKVLTIPNHTKTTYSKRKYHCSQMFNPNSLKYSHITTQSVNYRIK